jgi:hypothetical protein
MRFIEMHSSIGSGLGYIDVHLLASTGLSGVGLWTKDKALKYASRRLGVSFYTIRGGYYLIEARRERASSISGKLGSAFLQSSRKS